MLFIFDHSPIGFQEGSNKPGLYFVYTKTLTSEIIA